MSSVEWCHWQRIKRINSNGMKCGKSCEKREKLKTKEIEKKNQKFKKKESGSLFTYNGLGFISFLLFKIEQNPKRTTICISYIKKTPSPFK